MTQTPPNWNENWRPGEPDFVTPYQRPLPPPPTPPRKARFSRNQLIVFGALAAVVVIAVVAAVVLPKVLGGTPERTLTIHYALIDYESGGDCSGGGDGYSDIAPGMPVTVEDENHQVLASTTLPDHGQSNESAQNGCIWTMKVQVPDDRKQYGITGGRRGTVTFSHQQLASDGWSAVLSIGGDT